MQYRTNPKNGDKLSALGYGCMRFPTKRKAIVEEEAERLIMSAIKHGVNYFDTAYVYHYGKSEGMLGSTLAKHGCRDKVKIATKLPPYLVKGAADLDKIFGTQLSRLQTDRIDYYLIHSMSDLAIWEKLVKLGIEDWVRAKKGSGEIVNIGFSFHGAAKQFTSLIDAYDWDFCQVQYNYLDVNFQAGIRGIKYASERGIPVIVMEPLRGGKLAKKLPADAEAVIKKAKPERTAADWALRFALDLPETLLVLSGMGAMNEICQNYKTAQTALPGSLTEGEHKVIKELQDIFYKDTKIFCTACNYCLPCPAGVDIPACFSAYNEKYTMKAKMPWFNYMQSTGAATKSPSNASLCVKCGKCVEKCPQGIEIPGELKKVTDEMEGTLYKIVSNGYRMVMYRK